MLQDHLALPQEEELRSYTVLRSQPSLWTKACMRIFQAASEAMRFSSSISPMEKKSSIQLNPAPLSDIDESESSSSSSSPSSSSCPSSRAHSPHLDLSHSALTSQNSAPSLVDPLRSPQQASPVRYPPYPPGLGYSPGSSQPVFRLLPHAAPGPGPSGSSIDDARYHQSAPYFYDGPNDEYPYPVDVEAPYAPATRPISLPASGTHASEYPGLEYRFEDYLGYPTSAFAACRAHASQCPLALTVNVLPSNNPQDMEEHYDSLCRFLESDPLVLKSAFQIHSIAITIPSRNKWTFHSPKHPYDQSRLPRATRFSDCGFPWDGPDNDHPRRYNNEFPNLIEFSWDGMLGRRVGDGTYAALPSPFYDLLSLPYHRLRSLDLRHCILNVSDLKHIIRSSPELRTLIVDTVVDVEEDPISTSPRNSPHSWSHLRPKSEWPLASPATFYPLLHWEAIEDDLQLTVLKIRTTVDLNGFFSSTKLPLLRLLHYEPVGDVMGTVTTCNLPYQALNNPMLEELTMVVRTAERPALVDFGRECRENRPNKVHLRIVGRSSV